MSEANKAETTEHVPAAEVITETPATSIVDAAFDIGTKAVVDVLSFTRGALSKSAIVLESGAKKLEELSTALDH